MLHRLPGSLYSSPKIKVENPEWKLMMPFSTGTGLEHVGIVGPVRWLWTLDSSAKQETKRIGEGSLVVYPMPKSVLSFGKKRSTA